MWLWSRTSELPPTPLRSADSETVPSPVPTGNTLHVLSGHISSVTCGRFTPDGAVSPLPFPFPLFTAKPLSSCAGKKIVTCSEDSMLILWDPRTGEPIHKLLPADGRFRLDGGINCVAVNSAGTVAICGGAQGGLRAVNLVQGTVLAQMAGHEEGTSIEATAFSEVPIAGAATVTVLVSVGTDGRVCTWEANTFKLRTTGLHEVRPSSCHHFSPSRQADFPFRATKKRTPSRRSPSRPARRVSSRVRRTRRSRCGTTEEGLASRPSLAIAT